ncbi:DUF7490 domain-containing protein [Archaeoglobus veneficus]|uniref:DUF7490 domain-containing protein n=1 Tax=Archaeoglobus veneficus (strain DSM 11195 / SNP6) TaxID=693661 RepID=F2KRC8_ARCVS|nr:hypothetical protein [Archaeoglobus veneficus]AEA47862.1 hypothetical protein Arcve_1869 [Archaeoglobus veneficus SNP6]
MNGKIVAAIIAAIFIFAALLPLFTNVFAEERKPEREFVEIRNIEMKVDRVNESHAEITFIVSIYRSELVKNATLIISVYDRQTNLLLGKKAVDIAEKGDEGLSELNITLPFEKDRDYRIAFEIRKDNMPIQRKEMGLRGLETLVPPDKELKLVLKDVDFEITGVYGNKAIVKARFYIETMRDYDDVTFHVKAVQYESGVLANESWIELQKVEKGKTLLVESVLSVPKDYNYLVKIEAWRNGAMLKTWSKALNLAPTKTLPENITEEKVRFEIEEFVKGYRPVATPAPTTPVVYERKAQAPGFEILAAIAAGGAVLWMRKKRL